MKVLLINTLYHPNIVGGAERSVQFLAEALIHEGHKSVVITIMSEKGVKVSKINGVKVYYVGLKNLYWPFKDKSNLFFLKPLWHALDTYNPFMGKEVDSIIKIERPNVVHTNNLSGFSALVWPIVKKRGLPLVHTIRDYYMMCPASSMYKHNKNCEKQCWICNVYSKPKLYYSNLVDIVVGNSKFILDKHVAHSFFSSAQKEVIFNGYKTSDHIYQTDSELIRLGYIGQLSQSKGIEFVLNAINGMDQNHVKFTLDVAGRGKREYESNLKGIGVDNVRFLGFVEPKSFYSNIDILIVPSLWHEPLPRTIFEAYSYGVPVIGSKRGGIPEVIEEGKTGFLFDPKRPDEFIDLISYLMKNKKLLFQMSKNCLDKALEFAPDQIVKQYLRVYSESVGYMKSSSH